MWFGDLETGALLLTCEDEPSTPAAQGGHLKGAHTVGFQLCDTLAKAGPRGEEAAGRGREGGVRGAGGEGGRRIGKVLACGSGPHGSAEHREPEQEPWVHAVVTRRSRLTATASGPAQRQTPTAEATRAASTETRVISAQLFCTPTAALTTHL